MQYLLGFESVNDTVENKGMKTVFLKMITTWKSCRTLQKMQIIKIAQIQCVDNDNVED